jgi:hypothetical protein
MKQQDTDIDVFTQEAPASSPAIAPGEIIIGEVVGIDSQGQPLVNYPENSSGQPRVAMTTVGITVAHTGRNVALLFAKGDPQSPVIMGLIHSPLHDLIVAYDAKAREPSDNEQPASPVLKVEDVAIDGKRVVLEGKEEVVIKCGEASITLTKAGKILIRGNYLLNRSTGVNRILGGSVQVN